MSSLYLQNANGPAAEAILVFSDSVLLLILPIAFGLLCFLASLLLKSCTFRFFSEHQALEFSWTLIPILLLLSLAVPSLSLLYLIDEVGFPASTSKIIGHQWYWVYESCDRYEVSSFSYLIPSPLRLLGTDFPLAVPQQAVLRLLITAADVLHSWSIPS